MKTSVDGVDGVTTVWLLDSLWHVTWLGWTAVCGLTGQHMPADQYGRSTPRNACSDRLSLPRHSSSTASCHQPNLSAVQPFTSIFCAGLAVVRTVQRVAHPRVSRCARPRRSHSVDIKHLCDICSRCQPSAMSAFQAATACVLRPPLPLPPPRESCPYSTAVT